MKILYITNSISGPGGLERVLSIKTRSLVEDLGYEVHILTLNQVQPIKLFYSFSDKIFIHNINSDGNSLIYFINYFREVKKVIRKVNPDIISVCDDGIKGFFLPTFLNSKHIVIYERHASINLNLNKNLLNKNIFKRLKDFVICFIMQNRAKTFDAFIVLTKGNLKEWKSNNLRVISNPLSFFTHSSSSCTSKKVIAVGSHSHNKGYDLLFLAWKKIIKSHPDWVLEVFGKKDPLGKVVQLASDMDLEKSIFFYDPVLNIEEKYLDSSIFVLPSRSEGFGMVLIEAMSCGVPCVSFDCPHGPADIILNNKDGFLIENGDVDGFAEKVNLLIENKELRLQMGMNARINVKRFLPNLILKQWKSLFEELLINKLNN